MVHIHPLNWILIPSHLGLLWSNAKRPHHHPSRWSHHFPKHGSWGELDSRILREYCEPEEPLCSTRLITSMHRFYQHKDPYIVFYIGSRQHSLCFIAPISQLWNQQCGGIWLAHDHLYVHIDFPPAGYLHQTLLNVLISHRISYPESSRHDFHFQSNCFISNIWD